MLKKRLIAVLLVAVLCVSLGISVFALPPHAAYTYDNTGVPVGSPTPYTFESEVNGIDLGIGDFSAPTDCFVDEEDYIYIVDSKNSRIIILNSELEVCCIIGHGDGIIGGDLTYQGESLVMNNPEGVYVWEYDDQKILYICDTGNARIIRIDLAGLLDKKSSVEDCCMEVEAADVFGKPVISIIDANTAYKPIKLIVDRAGRMHVLCQTINRGIVKLNPDGTFNSFYGAPEVSIELYEKFWRLISSNEQLSKMEKYVATEYNNIAVDADGFVWVVTKTIADKNIKDSMLTDYDDVTARQEYAPIKKINSYGTDITSRTGTFPPVGDISAVSIDYSSAGSGVNVMAQLQVLCGISGFEDVTIDEYGCYSVLDSQRKKIFTYDCDGNLLFQFGNDGTQFGTFKSPVAVASFLDDKIIVLDAFDSSLMIFKPTDYGETILNAVRAYQTGSYVESEELWNQVLRMNSNNMMAYTGVGKSLYRNGEYKQAMEYFTISKNVEYYSKALEEQINLVIGKSFSVVFIAIVVIVVAMWLWKKIKEFRFFLRNGVKKVM